MTKYTEMSQEELLELKRSLEAEYADYQAQDLDLNMSRGKPCDEQLDLSIPMLSTIYDHNSCYTVYGTDCRNYGGPNLLFGLAEAKSLMSHMLNDGVDNIVIFGNSSLKVMYDTLARNWIFGTLGNPPWSTLDQVKWLCPVPGYDRHFAITESFGIEMINIPMNENGPDMDMVEELVANDASIKGMWCVPKYSNPTGITYSDEVVDRLASMKCAAPDFRIFWDNAYSIHHLYDDPSLQDELKNMSVACRAAGNPNRYYKFASTSKVTFPGGGIAAFAASPANIIELSKRLSKETIGYDKLNMLRHVNFLHGAEGLKAHMKKHAEIIRPKFEHIIQMFIYWLSDLGICNWTHPRGGYFISFDALPGTAKRIVSLAKDAGVTLTPAGATFPYGIDPEDSNIRIAPTFPSIDELEDAMNVFICCVKLAAVEKLLEPDAPVEVVDDETL